MTSHRLNAPSSLASKRRPGCPRRWTGPASGEPGSEVRHGDLRTEVGGSSPRLDAGRVRLHLPHLVPGPGVRDGELRKGRGPRHGRPARRADRPGEPAGRGAAQQAGRGGVDAPGLPADPSRERRGDARRAPRRRVRFHPLRAAGRGGLEERAELDADVRRGRGLNTAEHLYASFDTSLVDSSRTRSRGRPSAGPVAAGTPGASEILDSFANRTADALEGRQLLAQRAPRSAEVGREAVPAGQGGCRGPASRDAGTGRTRAWCASRAACASSSAPGYGRRSRWVGVRSSRSRMSIDARRPHGARASRRALVGAPSATGRSLRDGLPLGAADAEASPGAKRVRAGTRPGASPRHALRCRRRRFDGKYERHAQAFDCSWRAFTRYRGYCACTSPAYRCRAGCALFGSVGIAVAAVDARSCAAMLVARPIGDARDGVWHAAAPLSGRHLTFIARGQPPQLSATGIALRSQSPRCSAARAHRRLPVRKTPRRGGPHGCRVTVWTPAPVGDEATSATTAAVCDAPGYSLCWSHISRFVPSGKKRYLSAQGWQ